MKVLTVFAHNDRQSFCGGVLDRFSAGLADAGHTNEVVDLYAIKFDPVFRDRDVASYTSGEIPTDILELMNLEQRVLRSCRGPLQRFLASRAMRGKSPSEIAAMIRSRMPKDVLAQQEKVAAADALAFIAPVHFCSFPSILKGWIDRVFTLDFAFGLTSEGWHGDINGRIPLLHHQRALIMTSTIFDKHAYDDGIRDAIGKVIDDWGFRYPGIEDVEHVYFYAATAAPPETIHAYLDQAYQLGKDFGVPREARASLATNSSASRVMRQLPIVWQTARQRRPRPATAAPPHNTKSSTPCTPSNRRSDRSASNHTSRSANSTRPRSQQDPPHRTASGSQASRWKNGSKAPSEAAAAAPSAATPNAAPSRSAAPPSKPYPNDSSSRPRSSRLRRFSTLHQPRVHVRETSVVGTRPGAARHATPTARARN